MAQFRVKNNLPGSLHVPVPINRTLAGGEHVIVDLKTADMESAAFKKLTSKGTISVLSANSPRIDDDLEAPTFAAIEVEHRAYETLTHAVAQDNFEEILRTGDDVTSIINWTDGTKATKIRESQFTRDAFGEVTVTVEIQYTDGVESERLTKTYARNPDGSIASIATVAS
jgi:hypothetical protein